MNASDDFEDMAEACLKAHAAVAKSGTAEMLSMMRVLLFQIAVEITRREAEDQDTPHRAKPLPLFKA